MWAKPIVANFREGSVQQSCKRRQPHKSILIWLLKFDLTIINPRTLWLVQFFDKTSVEIRNMKLSSFVFLTLSFHSHHIVSKSQVGHWRFQGRLCPALQINWYGFDADVGKECQNLQEIMRTLLLLYKLLTMTTYHFLLFSHLLFTINKTAPILTQLRNCS